MNKTSHTFSMVNVSCGNNFNSCKVDELSSCVNCQCTTNTNTTTATFHIYHYSRSKDISLPTQIKRLPLRHKFLQADTSKNPCFIPVFKPLMKRLNPHVHVAITYICTALLQGSCMEQM